MQLDTQTIADWQVDLLKLDVCGLNTGDYGSGKAQEFFVVNLICTDLWLYSHGWPTCSYHMTLQCKTAIIVSPRHERCTAIV